MRKFVPLFFVLLLLSSKTVFAQCDSVYFRNTGTLIFDLLLLDTSKIIAVGDNGYVIKSVDGGKSWRNVSTFQEHILFAVYAASDSVLYAVGEYKTILKSEDQGETWFPLYAKAPGTYTSISARFNDVFFFTKDKGFIVGDDALLYSTKDGGRTWKDTAFSPTGSSRLYCISFVNDTLGFITGGDGTILRTKNGGANWEKINVSGLSYGSNIKKVKFLDALTGFAVGDNGMYIKTTDGGNTWTRINTPTSGNYMDVDFIDAQTGFIVGTYGNGIVLKTTNGGSSWSSQWNSFGFHSSGYAMATDKAKKKIVFAGGGGADFMGYNGRNIISTSDKGISYQQLSANARVAYRDIFFVNDSTGFIAGDDGICFKTSDYGESWKPLQSIPAFIFGNPTRCVFFLNEQEGYAASDRVYKTIDGGQSWNVTAVPGGGQQAFIDRMYFFTSQKGVAMDFYHVYQTTDGGTTWNTVLTTPYFLKDMCFAPGGKGFAVGYNGGLFVSGDQGFTWSTLPLGKTSFLTGVYFYNNTTGFIGTEDSSLYKTTDGGATWTWMNSGIRGQMRSFFFENDSTGYVMCNNNGGGLSNIYKTKNGGQTWSSYQRASENLTRFSGFKTVYIAGGNGYIAKTDRLHSPNIPGYIYGPDINCQNKKSSFITAALTGVNYTWTLSGGGGQSFKQNLDTVQWNAAGDFILGVTASNVCGTSPSRQIAITVNPVTAITTQPAAQSVCKGSSTKFAVVATGGSRQYQWRKSGVNIPGATDSTYTIPVTDSSHAGDYSVVITGLCGTVTSADAKLTLLSVANCTTAVTPVNQFVEDIVILPNPVLANSILKITVRKPITANFHLVDMNGKLRFQFVKKLVKGENKFDLPYSNLAPGVYQLRSYSEGTVLTTVRFIKL